MIVGVVFLHVVALHITGSNNPLGIDVKGPQDTLPFHPYYTIKDSFGLCVFFLVFAAIVFFAPNFFGEPDNYIPANPLATPPEIVPEWYLPAVLRHPALGPEQARRRGVMFGSILILFVLPWLDTTPGAERAVPPDLSRLLLAAAGRPRSRSASSARTGRRAAGWCSAASPRPIISCISW